MKMIPDGYEYYRNPNHGCMVNVIYRLAELGMLAVFGAVIGCVLWVFATSLVGGLWAIQLIDAVSATATWLMWVAFLVLCLAFLGARIRDWRAERDVKYHYSVDREIASDDAQEFIFSTYGDPNFPWVEQTPGIEE